MFDEVVKIRIAEGVGDLRIVRADELRRRFVCKLNCT